MPMAMTREQGQLCYPYGSASSDEEVLSAVLNALHHHSGIPQERVRVEVRKGHAVLGGTVEQEFERTLAEQVASTVPGVIEVTNQIAIES